VKKVYVVVDSPVGAEILDLPEGYETLYLSTIPYYYYHGTYYRYDPMRKIYMVIKAPVGLLLKKLPYGYKTVVVEGKNRYLYRGVYYSPIKRKGVIVYKVVK
jgi:hypothetical protein